MARASRALLALAACLLVLCLAQQACARRQDKDGDYADEADGYKSGYDKDYGDWLTNGYYGKNNGPVYTPGNYYEGEAYNGQPEYGYEPEDEYDDEYEYYRGPSNKPKHGSKYGKDSYDKKDDGYSHKKHHSSYEEDSYEDEDDYGYKGSRRHGYGRHHGYGPRPPPPPPTCGPHQWPDIPVCVDKYSGVRVNITNSTICKITANQWCRNATGTPYFCAYLYRPSTALCRGRAGPCDLPEFCNGTKPDCPADKFLPATVRCARSDRVCIKDAYCSGLSATCAGAHKKVRNGTPCRREGEEGAGLYTEVYGADGKLALFQAAEASTAALPAGKKGIDKHGSVTCDRCYQGHCKEFKWEWWSHSKETKDHYKRAYGNDYDEKTPYKGYSPQFYCNRDYGYGADASANQQ